MTRKTHSRLTEDNKIKDRMIVLERKILWLEKRYTQAMTAIADAVANTFPEDLQAKLFMDIAKRLEVYRSQDVTKKRDI